MPTELVGEIGSGLNVGDLNNMRLVNVRFNKAVMFEYGKKTMMTENVTIFPTFSSVASFLVGLFLDGAYAGTVRTITLVGEAPKTPELSYDISWIHLISDHSIVEVDLSKYSENPEALEAIQLSNMRILDYVNDKHAEWDYINKPFCHTGGYRTMLSKFQVSQHLAMSCWISHEHKKKLIFD